MVNKLTAAVVLLGATLVNIPVYAETPPPPAPLASAEARQATAASQQEYAATSQAADGAAQATEAVAAAERPTGAAVETVQGDLFQPAATGTQPAASAQPGAANAVVPSADLALSPPTIDTSVDHLNLKYVKGFVTDTGKVFSSPVRWDGKDWLKLGLVVGGTGALFLADRQVKNFAQSHQNGVFSKFAMLGNDIGNGLYILPAIGAYYGYGELASDHKARRVSLLALESFAMSGIITEGLKTVGGRHRPNTGDSPFTWDGPHLAAKNVSFSSGHTAAAFSIATVFANEYKDNPFVPPIAYGLATLTGLSRIYSNMHWSSDVFFGGAVGYFVSKAVLKLHKEDKDGLLGKRLSIYPQVGKEMTGMTVNYSF